MRIKQGYLGLVLATVVAGANASEGDWLQGVSEHYSASDFWCEIGVGFSNLSSRRLTRLFLMRPDSFARATSEFDRQARLGTTRPVRLGQYLRFAGDQAEEWSPEQRHAWQYIIEELNRQLVGLNIRLPIVFVSKTSGLEEFSFAYTRERTVFFPESIANRAIDNPDGAYKILAHEYFHIASRFDPGMRNRLFELIGFQDVENAEYPDEFRERKITNPDAFRYEHYIVVNTPDGPAPVVPITQARLPIEEFIQLPNPLAGVEIPLLVMHPLTGQVIRDASGDPVTYNFGNTDYVPRVIRNTDFIVDPEEIMADNFSLVMLRRKNGVAPDFNNGVPVSDLELLDRIEETLSEGCSDGQ